MRTGFSQKARQVLKRAGLLYLGDDLCESGKWYRWRCDDRATAEAAKVVLREDARQLLSALSKAVRRGTVTSAEAKLVREEVRELAGLRSAR